MSPVCSVWTVLPSARSAGRNAKAIAGVLDGLEQLRKIVDDEEHILESIDFERLRDDGVERKRTSLARGAQGIRGVTGG